MFRLSTISRVLTAPRSRKASIIIYYPSTLAQWLFFISDNKYYPQVLKRAMIRQSTISRVHTAPYTRKASKIIYYPNTLAQCLFIISDIK
jgi:hypothetical protein